MSSLLRSTSTAQPAGIRSITAAMSSSAVVRDRSVNRQPSCRSNGIPRHGGRKCETTGSPAMNCRSISKTATPRSASRWQSAAVRGVRWAMASTGTSVNGTIMPVRAGLQQILDLEQIEDLVFRGRSRPVAETRVFGGEVAGQALIAAARTVTPERTVHSLHAYFLRPGDPGRPILYQVDPIRDGRSFTTRRVVGIQHGEPIFTLSASFQVSEPGVHHQVPVLDAADPDGLPTVAELLERAGGQPRPGSPSSAGGSRWSCGSRRSRRRWPPPAARPGRPGRSSGSGPPSRCRTTRRCTPARRRTCPT